MLTYRRAKICRRVSVICYSYQRSSGKKVCYFWGSSDEKNTAVHLQRNSEQWNFNSLARHARAAYYYYYIDQRLHSIRTLNVQVLLVDWACELFRRLLVLLAQNSLTLNGNSGAELDFALHPVVF